MGKKCNYTPEQDAFLIACNSSDAFLETYPEIRLKYKGHPNLENQVRQSIRSRRNTLIGAKRRQGTTRTYCEHCRKRFLQEKTIKKCNQHGIYGVDVVTFIGPNESSSSFINMLIENSILLRGNTINSWEKDRKVYEAQVAQYQKYDFIKLNYGDIINAEATRYMDIDLMCNWKSAKHLLGILFIKQLGMWKVGKKFAFNFTLDMNRISDAQITETISDIFSTLLGNFVKFNGEYEIEQFYTNNKWCNVKKCIIENTINNFYDVSAYRYRDSSNMFTCSIIY
jgi:hypothetical protein